MYKINAYKKPGGAQILPLTVKRDWMDNTQLAHAYKCFPVSLTNSLGWGISFPEDISFIWDGILDSTGSHIKILEGQKYVYTERGNATVSFHTNITFVTEENVSLLTMPVPNQVSDGIMPFTTLMSTSFFKGDLPLAIKVTRPFTKITIKANTPVAAILPISLTDLNMSEIHLMSQSEMPDEFKQNDESYSKAVRDINMSGRWANFYRNATDHLGNKLGNHEVKTIKLKVIKK